MEPTYTDVQDIIMDLWDHCMLLEDEYHKTGNQGVLFRFAIGIMTVQYWEDVLLNIEGFDAYEFYF